MAQEMTWAWYKHTQKHTNTYTYTRRNTYTHMLTHTSITHTLVNVDEFVSVSMVRRRNKKRLDCPAGPKTDNGFRDVLVLSQIIKLKRWTNTTGRSVRCGYCAWLCVHVHVFVFGCPCTHVFVYEVCTGTRCSTLCRSSNVFLCVSACLGVCLFVCVFVCSPCLCMRCAQEQDARHCVTMSFCQCMPWCLSLCVFVCVFVCYLCLCVCVWGVHRNKMLDTVWPPQAAPNPPHSVPEHQSIWHCSVNCRASLLFFSVSSDLYLLGRYYTCVLNLA